MFPRFLAFDATDDRLTYTKTLSQPTLWSDSLEDCSCFSIRKFGIPNFCAFAITVTSTAFSHHVLRIIAFGS